MITIPMGESQLRTLAPLARAEADGGRLLNHLAIQLQDIESTLSSRLRANFDDLDFDAIAELKANHIQDL